MSSFQVFLLGVFKQKSSIC